MRTGHALYPIDTRRPGNTMKTTRRILAAAIFFYSFVIPAYTWQLGLGLTSYYSDWTPEFIGKNDSAKVEPALLAGFAASFRFYDRFVLSGQGMFTFLNHNAEYSVFVESSPSRTVYIDTNYKREETDISLMYIINSSLNIFAGYKRLHFDITDLNSAEATDNYPVNIPSFNNQFHIQGPGAGVSFKHPLAENLSANISTSLIYFNMKYYGYFLEDAGAEINAEHTDYTYNGLGNNTTLVLSYYIDSINTAVNLGARCQVIKYLDAGDAPKLNYDLNYGLTLSAMYFF